MLLSSGDVKATTMMIKLIRRNARTDPCQFVDHRERERKQRQRMSHRRMKVVVRMYLSNIHISF